MEEGADQGALSFLIARNLLPKRFNALLKFAGDSLRLGGA
jgi:hypothetical protein